MGKITMVYPERGADIQLPGVEILVDDANQRVEIYMLDSQQERVEGGGFDLASFTEWVLEYYNRNY